MKIAILGTRGIPNNYGGFEQVTENLAAGLVQKGHEVTVYNSHNHPNQEQSWKGITIKHCFDPEAHIGTAGQFIYDLNCIRHARKNRFDVWLFMGYTSSSVWYPFFPKDAVVISNMDGMEWKRSKYTKPVQRFLKKAERWAVKHSQFHIADSTAVKEILDTQYDINCQFIPYGADIFLESSKPVIDNSQVHYLLIARMEPENNIELILDGFHRSNATGNMLVVGRTDNKYGQYLVKKFANDQRIVFKGGVFDKQSIEALRCKTKLYFHGHSVGGTNPSLLEAMAAGLPVAAHNNVFNYAVLQNDAFYFNTADDVKQIIEKSHSAETLSSFKERNLVKIREGYNWEKIVNSYEDFIFQCYQTHKCEKYFQPKRYAYK